MYSCWVLWWRISRQLAKVRRAKQGLFDRIASRKKSQCLEKPTVTWRLLTCILFNIKMSQNENAAQIWSVFMNPHHICLLSFDGSDFCPSSVVIRKWKKTHSECQNESCFITLSHLNYKPNGIFKVSNWTFQSHGSFVLFPGLTCGGWGHFYKIQKVFSNLKNFQLMWAWFQNRA